MRLAVIAQQASAGGGTRFLRPLLRSLIEACPDLEITVFVNSFAVETFGAGADLLGERLAVVPIDPGLCATPGSDLEMFGPVGRRLGLFDGHVLRRLRSKSYRGAVSLARRLSRFDVVYLAWPYFLHPMDIDTPLVGTFHDFNYKHELGTLGDNFVALLETQVGFWLDRCEVVVASSRFIAEEAARFYPDVFSHIEIVRLSSLLAGQPDPAGLAVIRDRLSVPDDFVICPSNTSRHKNLERLLQAYVQVRANGGPPLVLIGKGTEMLAGLSEAQAADPAAQSLYEAFSRSGLRLGSDVYALGYVSDADADALISGARLLVAPSLYEAGSGPGLDAWALGTPVAMSAIPPFLEHLEYLHVEAYTFDPLDVCSIAATMLEAIADPGSMTEMGRRSQVAMNEYLWVDVARGYRAAFNAAIGARSGR